MIDVPPAEGTELIIVIPCYNETGILNALESLENCAPPNCMVEIIIVINHADTEDRQIINKQYDTSSKIEQWIDQQHKYRYHIIKAFNLPSKKAGVGLARKIGMDEAARRFVKLRKDNGIIVCFDADCTCTKNYLKEIHERYLAFPETNAALVYFEHETSNPKKPEINNAIINYELHLRYYVQALKYSNFPLAYHTVGSCITVRADIYQKQGGMNTRKAGEDFYFLQRIFPMGNIKNINSATVFPSPRASDRVPFGTGRAVGDMIKRNSTAYKTYNPQIFIDFKSFNDVLPKLWETQSANELDDQISDSIRQYLEKIGFSNQIDKLQRNFKSQLSFEYAVYNWFNGFKALKYVHYARDCYYPNIEILEAVNWILKQRLGFEVSNKLDALEKMRELDRLE